MSVRVNKVILAGNIASDIELRQTNDGTPVANFRLAVNNRDDKDTVFIDVAVFGAQASNTELYCSKGSAVLIDGRLEEDTWTSQSGEKRFKHYVVAYSVNFLNTRTADSSSLTKDPSVDI